VLEPRVLLGFVTMVLLTVGANLMLKLGAAVPAAERVVFGIVGWKSLAGLALFGCAGLLYAILLRWVPLNVAQAFTAAQFVGVVAVASLMLSEPISAVRWVGIVCISCGILLVGLTART
jgi:drug/metabolite transporter (DMT)-like permease